MGIVKLANLSEVIVGDIITYELQFTNDTGFLLNSVVIKDLLNPDLNFIEGSVKFGALSLPTANILKGVDLGTVGLNSVVNLFFQVKVINKSGVTLDNQSTVVYKYIDPIDKLEKINDDKSNVLKILVDTAELKIKKVSSVQEVKLNDIIDYKITLRNEGTIDLLNIVLKDLISSATQLVENSVYVNGILVNTENIEIGLNVGSVSVGNEIVVDYKVKVVSGTCSGYIDNEAYAIYNYEQSNLATGTKETDRVTVSISVVISSFKQQGLSKLVSLPLEKPDIEEVDDVTVDISIIDSYIVKTMISESYEGQNLSGYKLMIHGRLKMSIEYTALIRTQKMYSQSCEVPFSSFLILPPDYIDGSYVEVSTELENVEVDLLDTRNAMVNAIFLIIAKIS
ncbi:MAG: hypothetical protein ACRC57_05165 [Sarcina sp.]